MFTPSLVDSEKLAAYRYYAIALFGAAMTPYQVFFFSSGAVEEKWTVRDLAKSRLNVLVGFPLGGILSVAIAALSAIVLMPPARPVVSASGGVPSPEVVGILLSPRRRAADRSRRGLDDAGQSYHAPAAARRCCRRPPFPS